MMQRFAYLLIFCILSFWASGQVIVTQGEYYWDGDPGPGNGTPLLALDGNFDAAIEDLFQNGIDVSGLSVGAHNFSVRIKGQEGNWSNVFRQTIYISTPLIPITRMFQVGQAEYFWDGDPGQGNGTPLLALDGNFDEAIENLFQNGIDVSALSVGAHNFSVRLKGQDGAWSALFRQTIYISAPLTVLTRTFKVAQAEYFWDGDPGQGNGTPLLALDGNFDEAIEDLFQNGINVSALSTGAHNFSVRVKGQDGSWSALFRQTIYISVPLTTLTRTFKLTQAEYFWDGDPGLGNGVPLLAVNGALDEAIEALFQNGISVAALPVGAHNFSVRVKAQDGGWSSLFRMTVYIDNPLTTITRTIKVTQGEYYWDTDPGQGNATPLFVLDGNFDEAIEDLFRNTIDVSALSLGAHSFGVRVRGFNGTWSAVFKQTIYVDCSSPVPPSVSIAVTGNGACQGGPVQFTATAVNGGTSPSYLWRVNGIATGPNAAVFSSSTLVNGDVVTCELTSNSSCANPQTASSNSIVVSLTSSVTPTVSITASTGNSICTGTSVTFTAAVTNGGTTPVYAWKVNGSAVGTNSPTYTTSVLNNNDVVTCELTSSATCAIPATVTSNGITMTVSTLATPTIAISTSSNNSCAGTSVMFSASITGGGSSPAYQWKVNGFNVGTNSSTYSSSTLNSGDIVSCVLTSSLSCATTSTATSNSITMTINPTVSTVVSIASNTGSTICSGTSVTFTATPTNGGSPSYQWFVNGSPAGTNSATYTSSGLTNGSIVTCQMVSSLACATPSPATSNVITMTVNSSAAPTVSITSSQGSTICAGTNVTFTASPTNGGNSPSYQWSLDGSPVGTNSPTYSNASLTNGNAVSCMVTSNAPCVSGSTANSNTITMTVTTPVTPAVSISASATTICAGTSVTFTATPTNGGGSPSYLWRVNGSPAGTNSSTFTSSTLASGDVVTCELTTSLSCVTASSATSNSIAMTVNPTVATAVSIASSAGSTICSGTNVTFTATPANGGTPTYQWKINGLPVGTNSATYVSATLNNGDIVTCEMVSSLSCPSPTTAVSNAITMTVNSTAAPTIAIVSSQGSSICGGTNVTFTASVTNGGPSPTYQWSLDGSPVGTNSPTYSNASLTNGNAVSCMATSNAPCVSGSTANSNTITMTVTTPVTPAVSISASATTICAGTSVTFTATPTNGGGSPSYLWRVNGSPAGTNSSTFTTSTLASGDVVTCELTTSLSCVTASSATSNSIVMTVNPTVATAVSIISSAGSTICAGTNVTFTATPANGGTPTYQWKINGLPVGTNSATYVSATLNNGDIVTCEMVSSLSCPSPTTAVSNAITMTVNSTAAPTIAIVSSQGSSICSGTPVTFTATITNGGSSPVYQWYVNGSPVGTNSNTYSNAALSDNDAVTCELTSNAPCVTATTVTSNGITVTVTQSVTTDVSITASATTICSGTAVTFTATPTNGGTPTYQWFTGSTPAGTNSSSFTSSTLTNGQVVTCQMTSSMACAAPSPAISNGITMSVSSSANPTITITSNPSAATICSGTSVTFTASITNGGPAPVYQWKLNGTNVGTNSPTYTNATLATGDAVTCELTSNAPCVTVTTVLSNSISKTVNPSVTPTITITSNPTMPVCEHQSVTFTATITGGGSDPDYQWKKNGQNYGLDSPTYSTSLWSDGDVFTCVLTSNATCASPASVTSNAITADIVAVDATVSVNGNTLTANQAGATYQWYDCTFGTAIPGATGQSYTATETGLYSVTITMGSCSEESNCEFIDWNALNELSENGILLYPNPTAEFFTIELPAATHGTMTLYDVAGRKVLESTLNGVTTQQIDVSTLANGNYQLVLHDGTRAFVGKVIVNR